MKKLIIISLYLLGILVYMLWVIGDEEKIKQINEAISEDPEVSALPEIFIRVFLFIAIGGVSLIWPFFIVYAPFEKMKRLFK